ncbi:TRAP transporter small permease subunit [Actibacterium lipolyticum]|uniref:TRAP transporter small permease protein n=1 Tax=Actibacterium lipolyticum TaxID=1524263 RepID=A0A238JPD2_9RHOB|nr:TRAP transporter small permease subunit [Actibacterium lipolyticum]SMX32054.1 Tripartite ATP-independent periplasmic transporters, DctQ component [Actibacterium lipolyticum]
MPSLEFTLPHWMYWLGLILFPVLGMIMARRAKPDRAQYSTPLGYMILITGGILGLHRFYLKNKWGLLFLPIFAFVLYANGAEREARSALSDADNTVRVAEKTIAREGPRVESAQAELAQLQADFDAAEEGSFTKRSAEKRLTRSKDRIETGTERIAEARAELETAGPIAQAAADKRQFWSNAARFTFFALLALVALDAVLLPAMVRNANAKLRASGEDEIDVIPSDQVEDTKLDSDYAENWIDKMSLYAGEFVSYWAVIAVVVYYYEVIARYVFNSPTNWAHEAMYLMFGMQYLIAGSYAMLTEAHVRVDIFYAPMTRPKKAIADLATSIFFFIFAGTLLVTSYIFAFDAIAVPSGNGVVSDWARGDLSFGQALSSFSTSEITDPAIRWGEISFNEWEVPLWPMKWMMVVGGLLLVLQGISKIGKDLRAVMKGA